MQTPQSTSSENHVHFEEEGIDGQYSVEAILDKRYNSDGVLQYLLKWKNYDSSENTWEPLVNIDSRDLLDEFEATRARLQQKLSTTLGFNRGYQPKCIASVTRHPVTGKVFYIIQWRQTNCGELIASSECVKHCPDLLIDYHASNVEYQQYGMLTDVSRVAERVVGKRKNCASKLVEFCVKWFGYRDNDELNTWELLESVGCGDLVAEYEAKQLMVGAMINGAAADTKKGRRRRSTSKANTKLTFKNPGAMAESVVGLTHRSGPLMLLVRWQDAHGDVSLVSLDEAKVRCPALVVKFFEGRLQWKTALAGRF